MKKLIVVSSVLFFCGFVMSQARDGTVELKKTIPSEPAASIYLPYSPEVVKKALSDFILKTSVSDQKKAKDYLLSSNTSLLKNNQGADMHFVIDARGPQNREETVMYLKLNSSTSDENEWWTNPVLFTMQDAKDYLDNFAIAIKPYASDLQIALQQKNLTDAQKRKVGLAKESDRLEQDKKKLQYLIDNTKSDKKIARLNKQKSDNKNQIDHNLIEQSNQDLEIDRQSTSLDQLINTAK